MKHTYRQKSTVNPNTTLTLAHGLDGVALNGVDREEGLDLERRGIKHDKMGRKEAPTNSTVQFSCTNKPQEIDITTHTLHAQHTKYNYSTHLLHFVEVVAMRGHVVRLGDA